MNLRYYKPLFFNKSCVFGDVLATPGKWTWAFLCRLLMTPAINTKQRKAIIFFLDESNRKKQWQTRQLEDHLLQHGVIRHGNVWTLQEWPFVTITKKWSSIWKCSDIGSASYKVYQLQNNTVYLRQLWEILQHRPEAVKKWNKRVGTRWLISPKPPWDTTNSMG